MSINSGCRGEEGRGKMEEGRGSIKYISAVSTIVIPSVIGEEKTKKNITHYL